MVLSVVWFCKEGDEFGEGLLEEGFVSVEGEDDFLEVLGGGFVEVVGIYFEGFGFFFDHGEGFELVFVLEFYGSGFFIFLFFLFWFQEF